MYDVTILTETGVTGLSYKAVLWMIERALPEFPEGTLDRLDHGLDDGVMALNASDIDVISTFFYEKLDEIDDAAALEARRCSSWPRPWRSGPAATPCSSRREAAD